ncbi:MAG: cysteine--tRNA ligase [Devosia nanyangense]|uniref:Cysteine--tRNA ligase n=1 Tax=Devosia nanyangense TaxID=1228055 RepID=A0A933L1Y6_9HYPH|nr:cysteine--tRNA ligase [Devosia nanyangense]
MASGELKLRITNTLTRTKEDFVPLDPNNVGMYVCGPTVYDFAHIGNARPAIVFDVLFRLLRHVYGPEHVTYVRNITDVDDKINARAARDFPGLPLNEAIRKVTETTANQYQRDVTALGCLEPTVQPRATENIPEMIAMIGELQQRGHAYEADGEMLFDVGSMPDYGALSGRNLEENLAGARVEVSTHKKNPADFVLWKQSSPEEPGWESPWGRGRPGWHLECSAMSERYLGQMFDIHAGGLDLIFPHHENEIAQSRCAHGTPTMARYWMHNGFLQVEGQKMSKSLGNFITINELLETEKFGGLRWPGSVLRLAMLSTHYRQPIDFSVRSLEEAAIMLSYCATFGVVDSAIGPSAEFQEALLDDLNTPRAIAELHRLLKLARFGTQEMAKRMSRAGAMLREDDYLAAKQLAAGLLFLGIDTSTYDRDWMTKQASASRDTSHVQAAVAERLAALNAKDFKRADEIRAALLAEGIQLMDSKNEAGERVTKWEVKR